MPSAFPGAGPPPPRRLAAGLTLSAAAHALVVALLALRPAPETPDRLVRFIPIALVGRPGGGSGPAPSAEPEAAPAPAPTPPPPPQAPAKTEAPKKPVAPAPPKQAIVRHQKKSPPPRPERAPAAEGGAGEQAAATSGAAGAAGGGNGAGNGTGGNGTGGDGTGGAYAAYGVNPLPPYPARARRLGIEGRVLLDVLVRADGRAGEVRVKESSGNHMLDESAVSTVRARWRFVPARQEGRPVASRVTVPIRFKLDQG